MQIHSLIWKSVCSSSPHLFNLYFPFPYLLSFAVTVPYPEANLRGLEGNYVALPELY